MSSGAPLRLRAPAKLNLGLSVIAKRGDGYHEIDTVMARVALHDVIELTPAAELTGELHAATGGPALHGLDMGPGNLALRAARLYLDRAGIEAGVHVRLLKRIPVAAGLGGGSSDAAAVLLGLARLHPSAVNLDELAGALGSDVPFFLRGYAAARARGRGERLEPLRVPRLPVVLLSPNVPVAAAEAYAGLQALSPRPDVEAMLTRLAGGSDPGYRNSLQAGVSLAHPEVREALSALRAAGLRGVLMSGSGSTCFGLAASIEQARAVADRLAEVHPRWWSAATLLEG